MKYLAIVSSIAFGVIFTIAGDVCFKRSQGLLQPRFLLIGIGFYAVGCLPIAYIFTKTEFGRVFIIWEALTVVSGMLVGRFMFAEHFTVSKLVAMTFALAALVLSYR